MYTIPSKFTFKLSAEERASRLQGFVNYLRVVNPELGVFVESQKDGFFQNLVEKDYGKVHKGDKLIKAFKHFESDPQLLRVYQDKASLLLSEDIMEGYLTVSVHPFDFLTLSDNNHHWTSCHSLKGDYRVGNLSYMTDSSTVVCYLSNNKPEPIRNCPEDFEWNSKKWRCLLYFSDNHDMIFASRPYPFENEFVMDLVLNRLLPESGIIEDTWSQWNNKYISSVEFHDFTQCYNRLIPLRDGFVNIHRLFSTNSSIYNDILQSSTYKNPYYAFRMIGEFYVGENGEILNKMYPGIDTHFRIGRKVKCLCCNQEDLHYSEMIYCPSCLVAELGQDGAIDAYPNVFYRCDRCNNILLEDTGFWVNDEEYVCEDCATQVPRCVDCDNLHDEDGTIYYDDGECLCVWCQKDREEIELENEESKGE